MIVKNRLLNYKNKIIYQDSDWFNFSLDSVILADFVEINRRNFKILDLATGNAPIPMLLTYKTKEKIIGIEIQKEVYDLAIKSILENKMENQITIINDDIKNIKNYFKCESLDIVTCNPPYFKLENSKLYCENEIKRIARHEVLINFEEIIKEVSYVLKNKGHAYFIHRTERLVEIFELLKKYRLEPKKIRFVFSKIDSNSNLVLIETVKNGGSLLKIMKPLIVHNEDGAYSKEIREMFQEKR